MIEKKAFIPDRPSCDCSAYGCKLLGTMTASTTGSSEWFCWLHFGKPAAQWQRITAEINRLGWLADIIRGVRMHYAGEAWADTYRAAKQSITVNQSGHLLKTESESVKAWMLRLEGALSAACSEPVKEVAFAHTLAPAADTWSKVGFESPVAA
jgi:hypothetical protein